MPYSDDTMAPTERDGGATAESGQWRLGGLSQTIASNAERRRSRSKCRRERLPEGITFHCPDTIPHARNHAASQAKPRGVDPYANDDSRDLTGEELAGSILFRADGTTSDAQIVLEDDRGDSVVVSLRGLTGTAKVGPVLSVENRR